jgi:serine/threonine protein kinase
MNNNDQVDISSSLMTDEELAAAKTAARRYDFIGFVFDHQTRTRFDLIKLLGYGAYGRVFSATASGAPPPQVAIKVFSADPEDEPQRTGSGMSDVETEFAISTLIKDRLGQMFCDTRVVCAFRRFYAPKVHDGVLIFPYIYGINLERWLLAVQYRAMDDYRTQRLASGFTSLAEIRQDITEAQQNVSISRTNEKQRWTIRLNKLIRVLNEQVANFSDIQARSMALAHQMLEAFTMLHDVHIYHRDIKPANMMVEFLPGSVLRLRIIDFGISCAQPYGDNDVQYNLNQQFFECPLEYRPTYNFRDPLSIYPSPDDGNQDEIRHLTTAFEVYSIGKVLQVLFDPMGISALGKWPVVRATGFMPADLHDLIVEMTNENNYVADTRNFDINLAGRTLAADNPVALAALEIRPSAEEALVRFESIRDTWYDLTTYQFNDDVE